MKVKIAKHQKHLWSPTDSKYKSDFFYAGRYYYLWRGHKIIGERYVYPRNSDSFMSARFLDLSCFIDKENEIMNIKVKYFDKEIDKIEKISKGDWVDLRAAETVELKAGEFKLIPLGVGMILPDGYEANIVPRSSTFKTYGIIQTNHYGVIDNSYSGDNDQWMFPAYATRDTIINKNDRICQFRINKIQPEFEVVEVEHLNVTDRGGFGSTGK